MDDIVLQDWTYPANIERSYASILEAPRCKEMLFEIAKRISNELSRTLAEVVTVIPRRTIVSMAHRTYENGAQQYLRWGNTGVGIRCAEPNVLPGIGLQDILRMLIEGNPFTKRLRIECDTDVARPWEVVVYLECDIRTPDKPATTIAVGFNRAALQRLYAYAKVRPFAQAHVSARKALRIPMTLVAKIETRSLDSVLAVTKKRKLALEPSAGVRFELKSIEGCSVQRSPIKLASVRLDDGGFLACGLKF